MASRVLASIISVDGFKSGRTFSISNDGDVLVVGKLSNVPKEQSPNVFPPEIISSLKSIRAIDCGLYHTTCLDFSGTVYTFGNNNLGQLGVGIESSVLDYSHIPQIVRLPPIQHVTCGTNFTVCLSDEGELYSFGYNINGQLGIGTYTNSISPQKIDFIGDISIVQSSGNCTFCITYNNDVYVWGVNNCGQLGMRNTTNYNVPTKAIDWPEEEIIDIKCGSDHMLLLTANQEVYSCGANDCGQLGRITENSFSSSLQKIENLSCEIIRIECGYFHSMCFDIHGNLYVFGYNSSGQLGLGDTNSRNVPVKHPSLSNIIDISSKGIHSYVKTSNNEIYAFGNNKYSQLGIETELEKQLLPIRVFQDNEDIWRSNFKSMAKSARFTSNIRPVAKVY